jgi:hypothetical protein
MPKDGHYEGRKLDPNDQDPLADIPVRFCAGTVFSWQFIPELP